MRRVAVARADEHGPTGHEPYMTEYGLAAERLTPSGQPATADGDVIGQDDDEVYEIDKIVSAERIGVRYRIWIKWKGYTDVTWRWWSELKQEGQEQGQTELLKDMERAVEAARAKHRLEHGHLEDDDEPPPADDPPNLVSVPETEPVPEPDLTGNEDAPNLAQRRPRRRNAKYLLQECCHHSLITFLAACDDYAAY